MQRTQNFIRCHLWGAFATVHWKASRELPTRRRSETPCRSRAGWQNWINGSVRSQLDPETRLLPCGQPVVSFSIATNESFKDKNGDQQERIEWHSVVAFARLGEICAEHRKKSRQVFVEGHLRTRGYEPKNGDGKRRAHQDR